MEAPTLRIYAWNPCGIRSLCKNASEELERFIVTERPDVVFFPETKGNVSKQAEMQLALSKVFEKAAPGVVWKYAWSHCTTRPGMHGNAVVYRDGLPGFQRVQILPEVEGRKLAMFFEHTLVVGLYVVNAGAGCKRLEYKVQWLRDLRTQLDELAEGRGVIAIGDINVAPDERDLCNPDTNFVVAGFTPEERKALQDYFLADGGDGGLSDGGLSAYVDVWRERHPLPVKTQRHKGVYSYWSTRSKTARANNAGWRIDLVLADRRAYERVTDVFICPQYKGSDHCPVGVEIRC